jgi:hypothetical protein
VIPALPAREATDDEVKAWVKVAVQALDATDRQRNWRFRALGSSYAEALADSPREARLGLKIPVGEMRIVREVAKERGIGTEQLMRRAFATWLVAIGEVDPEAIPYLTKGGMLRG